MSTETFSCATTCGHLRYETSAPDRGLDWCFTCHAWVGVIVLRVDPKREQTVTSEPAG